MSFTAIDSKPFLQLIIILTMINKDLKARYLAYKINKLPKSKFFI